MLEHAMTKPDSRTPVGKIVGRFLAALIGFPIAWATGEMALNSVRGYQLVVLKTRMYWENGNAVVGDKIKTWKIAVPNSIWLHGNPQSWSLLSQMLGFIPVYSDRREDFGTDRYVTTLTSVLPDNSLVGSPKKEDQPEAFSLTFSNKIAHLEYKPPPGTRGCVFQGEYVDYHGWVVRVPPEEYHNNSKDRPTIKNPIRVDDVRFCKIIYENLDKWTLHIDDLQSKDSGE